MSSRDCPRHMAVAVIYPFEVVDVNRLRKAGDRITGHAHPLVQGIIKPFRL